MTERPRVLIEDWLPIEKIGAESQRERGASSALPPLYFLHVWWARRPLTVSRAAILASLLPAWSDEWPTELRKQFPTRESYQDWFTQLVGIFGDPAKARKWLNANRGSGKALPNPYGYPRAFTTSPGSDQIATMAMLLRHAWGTADPGVMDTFAGGGSIPFEALRYGFTTYANELNPVASVILRATLDYPARFGHPLVALIEKYGKAWSDRVRARLRPYFTDHGDVPHLVGACYLWARTVACPYTGKPIPLSPNWWLLKGSEPAAVEPIFHEGAERASFRIVYGKGPCSRIDPDKGTVRRGDAVSPWASGQVVDGDYIKAEAQAGRMGQQLYCVGLKKSGGFEFRAPTAADLAAVDAAETELARLAPAWDRAGIVPRERYPEHTTDRRPLNYGMPTWADFFSPRQLLSLCTAAEELRAVAAQIRRDVDEPTARAVATYLALALDKAADYDSRMSRWDGTRNKIANTFDRHDFSFKWSHAEFDAAHNLLPWVVGQVADACGGIVKLATPDSSQGLRSPRPSAVDRLEVSRGSAADLPSVKTGSLGAVVVDPPYYDNVQYAECSDFFYVWQKRTLGHLYPEWFADDLTNKDEEAVANPSRFDAMGRKKKAFAEQDYERKMEACFREMHRVLRDDGVLTVMFTHKKVEAWDTLGAALINAGFSVHASWPVHTESEHSLHQAKKNAAASTILLSCRKRAPHSAQVWWDDLKQRVRGTARERAAAYQGAGIRGVDLYIATFGPVLAVVSENWPVLTSEVDPKTGKPRTLRPEAALEIAREEVVSLRRRGLLLGREVKFDPVTDWYLMAWDAFRAESFPADEGRKLSIALGLDLDRDLIQAARVVGKKGAAVTLQQPAARRKRGMVDPDAETFSHTLDAAHTAMLVFEEDGGRTCERWLRQRGLDRDATLAALWQAIVNALPPQKKKGEWVRPEMATLDRMNDALGLGISFPPEEKVELPTKENPLLGKWGLDDIEPEADDEDGDSDEESEDDDA